VSTRAPIPSRLLRHRNLDREKNDAVYWDGLSPLTGGKIGRHSGRVRFLNVKNLVGLNELSEYDERSTTLGSTKGE